MKKIISLVLIAALMLSMCAITAFAGDEQPVPTTGPAKSTFLYGGARLGIYDTGSKSNSYIVNYNYSSNDLVIDNEAVPGATYDLESNTLTVDNVHQRSNQLFIWYMGDDFKLNVVGECEFGIIYVYNYFNFYSTSLNIIGNGTLTVNQQLINKEAIHMYCDDGSLMHLDIADTVNVHLYSSNIEQGEQSDPDEEQSSPVVVLSTTTITPENGGAITGGSKALPEAKSNQIVVEKPDTVPVIEVFDRDKDYGHGKQLKSKSDPDGVYALTEIMDGVSYIVSRYMYVKDLDMWVVDHSFAQEESFYSGRRYNQAEFEAEYDYVYGLAPTQIKYLDEWGYANRGSRAVRITKDGELDAVYAGTVSWEDDWNNPSGYTVYRVTWDEDEEIYAEDPSFRSVYIPYGDLAQKGYHVETEEVEQRNQLTVWTATASSGENRFEVTGDVLKKKNSDDMFVQVGTYNGNEGISIKKIHFDPETDEHYILYSDYSYSSGENYLVSYADLDDGTSDFYYDVDTVIKPLELRFVNEGYSFDNYAYNAVKLNKKNDSAVYAYKTWKHYSQGSYVDKYAVIRLVKRDDRGGHYFVDESFEEYEFADPSYLEWMDYEIDMSDQPLEYVTKGNIDLMEYPVYTDKGGSKYYADSRNNIFSFTEDDVITLGGYRYYYGVPMSDLSVDDLNDTVHEVVTDNYSYWIDGPEYHHIAGEQPEPFAYALWVNGEQITSDHLTVSCGKGTATFNPSSNTLTLNNAEITKGTETDWTYSGILSHLPQISIVIMGDCTITETGGDGIGSYSSEPYQVGNVTYSSPYDITVCGVGTLTIVETTPANGYGIYCTGNLVLDGIKLNVTSAAAGVWSSSLEMRSVEADIHSSTWYSGIVVNRGDFAYDNSNVTAISDNGAGLLLGNDNDFSNLTVNSGTLSLKGKLGVQSVADKSVVTVNGGKLSVESTDAAFDASFLADEAKNIVMGEGICVTSGAIDGTSCVIEELKGFTVSGSVKSFGRSNPVTVQLLKGEEVVDSVSDTDLKSYSFENVQAGDYTIRVSKENHVTRDYPVTVTEDLPLNVEIHLLGDVTGDGKLNVKDYGAVNKHIQNLKTLTGYDWLVADAKTDGKINAKDLGSLNKHIQNIQHLWPV